MTEKRERFIDSASARLMSLAFAVALAAAMLIAWGEDMVALVVDQPPAIPASSFVEQSSEPANPARDACLKKRLGDVEQMRDDGVINDAQHAQFSGRAVALCESQHP